MLSCGGRNEQKEISTYRRERCEMVLESKVRTEVCFSESEICGIVSEYSQ